MVAIFSHDGGPSQAVRINDPEMIGTLTPQCTTLARDPNRSTLPLNQLSQVRILPQTLNQETVGATRLMGVRAVVMV